jgi:hypothetical protein
MLLPLVAAAKIHFKEQALATGTKQSSQANKAGRLTSQTGPKRQSGLPVLLCASMLCFVLATSTCSNKWILH